MNHRMEFIPGKYNVVHEGKVVGEAILDEDGHVTEASITSEGLKGVLPDYDPTEGLSIVEPPQYVGDYLPIDINLAQAPTHYQNKQKGTFDA